MRQRKKGVRSQALIALFNGEGFVIVKDNVFKARRSAKRRDVNLDEDGLQTFLDTFLADYGVPADNTVPVIVGPVTKVRRLSIVDYKYNVLICVFRVPSDFKLSSSVVQSFSTHQLAEELDTLLAEAQRQLLATKAA